MWRKNWIYCLILISLCFLVYSNSLNNAFVSDDITAIAKNPLISHPSHYWLYPASLLDSFCYLVAKENPLPYHLVSVILHSLSTVLVFYFLSLFFNPRASFLAACLFAVHPVHTEAVTWISGKPYLILALFIFVTYFLYERAVNTSNRRHKLIIYLLSLFIFSYYNTKHFGFYSLTPFLLILSDPTFNRWRKNWKLWLPFLAILITRLILARVFISERMTLLGELSGYTTSWRDPITGIVVVLFSHFGLLLWPLKLTLYHEPLKFNPVLLNTGIISLFLLIFSLPFLFKKAKEIFFGILIFILFFAPAYAPVPITSMLVAERYLYFPSVTLSIFAAFLYERYIKNLKGIRGKLALILFMIIMFFYTTRTLIRNADWKNPEKFWQVTLAASPDSPSPHNEMGIMYYKKGKVEPAITSFKKALEINPRYSKAYNNLGNVYSDMGRREEAISLYKQAIEISPHSADAYNNLGNVYSDMGRREEAISLYKQVIRISPNDLDAYYNLGNLYYKMGRKEEAIVYFKKAITINPRDFATLNNLGIIYVSINRREDAIKLFKRAIESNPNYAAAHFNLCLAYFYEKKYDLAIKYCDRASESGYEIPTEFLQQLKLYKK